MTPEMREFIKHAGFGALPVEQIAAVLPDDELELDEWIAETIREHDSMGFHLVTFAALSRERPVDARHLSMGTKLSGGSLYLAAFALRVQGDMPEYLIEGLRDGVIPPTAHSLALLCIVLWCDERRNGTYPDQLIPQAWALARRVKSDLEVDAYLLEVAARSEDTTLERMIRDHYPKVPDANWQKIAAEARKVAQTTIDLVRGPLSAVLPKEPVYSQRLTATVQRAVPRIGRNAPCPCGSGKKYKQCCSEKDARRLRESSEVAGLTQRELLANPEPHLTLQRLHKKSVADIIGMDAAAIPRHLLPEYFFAVAVTDIDLAATNLEKLGYDDDLEDCWFSIMFSAFRTKRPDIGERMLELRRPFGLKEADLHLSHRLLLACNEPGKWLRMVEDAARSALKTESAEELVELAFSVAFSDASALGILLYRGVLPFIPPAETEQFYEHVVLPIRERLNLPVHDPLKEFLDNRSVDAEVALREAETKYEAKRREVRELREGLEQKEKELARREAAPAPQSPAPQPLDDTDPEIRQLRDKVRNLKSDLNQRHTERNELQHRLERMQTRVDSLLELSHNPHWAETQADDDAAREDELLLPQEAETHHPFRRIEFPRNFPERLNDFPHHIARGAMSILGRLAGGDPAAFNGAKCIKGVPTVVRQRVGIDFRLLLRLLPDRIEVIDLIPRQDLERRIKTLK